MDTKQPLLFVFDEQARTALSAAGVIDTSIALTLGWPLMVGDTITFSRAPTLAFRVTHRHLQRHLNGDAQWMLTMAPAPWPIDDRENYARPQG